MTEMNHYKADLRELEFALFEQFDLGKLLKTAVFKHIGEDDARLILKEGYAFATTVIGPTMGSSDRKGCVIENGVAKAPPELREVWKKYYADGWNMLTQPQSTGGQGAPNLLGVAVTEMMSGANTGFHMYPGLSMGAASVIRAFGTPEQKELYATRIENGDWGGTMVLTEPHAGSDVGLSTSKAVPKGDGTYSITGNKIFISSGDHDLAENIVHLVLARVEGAPKGTRGLSLFIVPKRRVNADGSLGPSNDVVCTKLEHKMGINSSATAALSFGEAGNCLGQLVGGEPTKGAEPGEGMRKMFLMMNGARFGVGVQGLAVASTAYLNALAYARTRLQGAHPTKGRGDKGAVPIIDHADVRRMLLEMKCLVEGCRALIYSAVRMQDEAHALRADQKTKEADELEDYMGLFIPLVKAFTTDSAVHVASMAMQVYGGHGYLKDHPVEQYLRDARIFPIYEGTNGIQALDLVGRKLGQGGGKLIGRFGQEWGAFAAAMKDKKGWEGEAATLTKALAALNTVVGKYLEFFTTGKADAVLVSATRFLEVLAKVTIARHLADAAFKAETHLAKVPADGQDAQFYKGKIASARYFLRNILPGAVTQAEVIATGDITAIETPDGGFSLAV
jgi:alkylation response protein AidB-like acyl-CoA dehydrogenase